MAAQQTYDAIVVGGGAAGLAAALALSRLRRPTLVLDSKTYRNRGARHMHMIPGLDHVDPVEYHDRAQAEMAGRYKTLAFEQANVVSVKKTEGGGGFVVEDEGGKKWEGKKLVLASGSMDKLPEDIEGYKENWPAHIYQCPYCDGLESSGQPVGILGFPTALYWNYVQAGFRFDDRVIIFLNGREPTNDEATQGAYHMAIARGAVVENRHIKRLVSHGPGPADGVIVELDDGEKIKCGCIFHHPDTVNRAQHLIDQLAIETSAVGSGPYGLGGEIVLKQYGETSVSGIFAAGDTITFQKSAAGAIASGNLAGVGACLALASDEGLAAIRSKKAPPAT